MKKLLVLLLLFSSCSYRVEKELQDTLNSNQSLGFAEIQSMVFAPKCARCHSGMVGSYDAVIANLSEIGRRVQLSGAGMMPPASASALSEAEKNALLSWIANGAPLVGGDPVEQPSAPPGAPPTTPPVGPPPVAPVPPARLHFAYVKERVLTPKCARCHSGMVSNYESVLANIREIEDRIQITPDDPLAFMMMPPEKAPPLSQEEKDILLRWIQDGAPRDSVGEPPSTPVPTPDPCSKRRGGENECEDDDDHPEDDHPEDDRVAQVDRA